MSTIIEAEIKPINNLPKLITIAERIWPLTIPSTIVCMTGKKLGNINSGKLENLDVTSHMTTSITMKMIRLKTVVITHFILKHLFNFTFYHINHVLFLLYI